VRTAVITTVKGRGEHLRLHLRGLARSVTKPDLHVIVAMNDPAVARIVEETGCPATVVDYHSDDVQLPLAAARNFGAGVALDRGAQLLVFLDVDCIPAVAMLPRYQRVAEQPAHARALLCGMVSYLPPPPPAGYDLSSLPVDPHPARPAPPEGQVLVSTDYQLFWSLSFALTAATWARIGGFCTDYRGYGGEDTDFGQLARAAGVTLRWVGGAHAFHQHHPVSEPPVEHLRDIVANAQIFHRRWGWWPMTGWLQDFARRDLIRWDADRLQLI
jgi:N-acetylglucosaminyl-diphospho-decaprenol L-rhamnosyltransferase